MRCAKASAPPSQPRVQCLARLRPSKVHTKCLNYFQSGSNVDPTQTLKAGFVESIPSHGVRKPKERCAIGETVDTREMIVALRRLPRHRQGAVVLAKFAEHARPHAHTGAGKAGRKLD